MKTRNVLIICGVIFMISFAMNGNAMIDAVNDLIEATTVNATYLQAKSGNTITLNSSIDVNGKNLTGASNITSKTIGGDIYAEQYAMGSSTGGIQESIDALNVGGGYVQTIKAKGTITVSNNIDTMGRKVELDLDGAKLIATGGLNKEMITINGSDIKIIGGIFDGNKASQSTSPTSCIRTKSSGVTTSFTNITIEGSVFYNCYDQSIDIVGVNDTIHPSNITINNIVSSGAGRNGIYIGYYADSWKLNDIESFGSGSLTEGFGIMVGDAAGYGEGNNLHVHNNALYGLGGLSNNSVFSNVRSHNNNDTGVWISDTHNLTLSSINSYDNNGHGIYILRRSGYPSNIKISGNTWGNAVSGLVISAEDTVLSPSDITLDVNSWDNTDNGVYINGTGITYTGISSNNGKHGIAVIQESERIQISNAIVKNNDKSNGGYNGIDIAGKNTTIIGTSIYDDQLVPTQTYNIFVRSTSRDTNGFGLIFGTVQTGDVFVQEGHTNTSIISKNLSSYDGTRWCSGTSSIGIELDNGTSVLPAGIQGDIRLPWSGTITEATIMSRGLGNLAVQFWIDSLANFPPTVADLGGRTLTLTGGISTTDVTLSGWTTTVTKGDVVRFNVSAVPTVNNATVQLTICKN